MTPDGQSEGAIVDTILTLNAGSSSIKFSLFAVGPEDDLKLSVNGLCELVGSEQHFIANNAGGSVIADDRWVPKDQHFQPVLEHLIGWVENYLGSARLAGVGHRVVHGGTDHIAPELVTPALLTALEKLIPLAPLHEPHNLAAMRAMAAVRPGLPQVACFDTAFHSTMPAVATRYGLPRAYEREGVRRYGFHGLSYENIAHGLRKVDPALARGRVIAAHLGNGASLCAMNDGRSVDTTMGFTALDGLVMGSRCGAIDPGVILFLQQEKGLPAAKIEELLYKQSGLLGVSGLSSDMRSLLASPDLRAQEAVELFVFRIIREIGALTSTLGGLDGLIFTAGIGEHAPEIRSRVCAALAWLGVELDESANQRGDPLISGANSRIAARVIPANEELMIARHTLAAIGKDTATA